MKVTVAYNPLASFLMIFVFSLPVIVLSLTLAESVRYSSLVCLSIVIFIVSLSCVTNLMSFIAVLTSIILLSVYAFACVNVSAEPSPIFSLSSSIFAEWVFSTLVARAVSVSIKRITSSISCASLFARVVILSPRATSAAPARCVSASTLLLTVLIIPLISVLALVRSVISFAKLEFKLLIAAVFEETFEFVSVNLLLVSVLFSFTVVVNPASLVSVSVKLSDTAATVALASLANCLASIAISSAWSAIILILFSASVALSLSVITLFSTSRIFSETLSNFVFTTVSNVWILFCKFVSAFVALVTSLAILVLIKFSEAYKLPFSIPRILSVLLNFKLPDKVSTPPVTTVLVRVIGEFWLLLVSQVWIMPCIGITNVLPVLNVIINSSLVSLYSALWNNSTPGKNFSIVWFPIVTISLLEAAFTSTVIFASKPPFLTTIELDEPSLTLPVTFAPPSARVVIFVSNVSVWPPSICADLDDFSTFVSSSFNLSLWLFKATATLLSPYLMFLARPITASLLSLTSSMLSSFDEICISALKVVV